MTPQDKRLIKQVIEARIAELQQLMRASEVSLPEKSEELADEATRNDTLAGIAVDSALLAKARRELNALQNQLPHLDDEDFGNCESCGEAITTARIAMVPATRLCIACAQQQEQKQ